MIHEIGYFLECDLEYPQNIKKMKQKIFHFVHIKLKQIQKIFLMHMNSVKFKNYNPSEKLICDQTDKKIILFIIEF